MVDIEDCDVLDLFAGTGSVSYEFASRGARSVTAVEINAVHNNFIRQTAATLGFKNFFPVKANVFNYLRACTRQFDIIFSDAPYDLPGSEEVVSLVFERGLLRPADAVRDDRTVGEGSAAGATSDDIAESVSGENSVSQGGLLIFEHSKDQNFEAHPNFVQTRNYGSVQFSFFRI